MTKKIILALVVVAAAGVIAYKLMTGNAEPTPQTKPAAAAPASAPASPAATPAPAPASSAAARPVVYLFHDPSDQDAGCRRVYAYADRAEKELAGKVDVRRPDVEREKDVVEKFNVKVLPTVLYVSATGEVLERCEGEDKETFAKLDQGFEKLKASVQ